VQARDVMTTEVVTVGPETSAKYAGELMAEHGFAALPVVDDDGRLVGIVAEGDVLRGRLPQDPRLHLRREQPAHDDVALLVRGVMTTAIRTVEPAADLADLARLLTEERLRSVPVVVDGALVGIVSRRDVLRALVRPDADIRDDVLRLVEAYTGDLDCWDVRVIEGVTSVTRTRGAPEVSRAVEEVALQRLVTTVPGVVAVHVLPGVSAAVPGADARG
jgi:CBS domain-containing protein